MAYLEQCDWCKKIVHQYSGQQLRDKGVNKEQAICGECQKKIDKLKAIVDELPNKLNAKITSLVNEARGMLEKAITEMAKE